MTDDNNKLIYKCGCGKVQIPLKGEEPYLEGNCCCRSCVSALKFIDSQKKNKNGISGLTQDGTGVAMAAFPLNAFELPPSSDLLEVMGLVKVGEEGTKTRVYTKCCGSFMFHGGGSGWPFAMRMWNRNALFHQTDDNECPYVSPSEPCISFMVGHSFDPSKVPEPKVEGAPDHFKPKFGAMADPDFDVSPYKGNPVLYPDLDKAEVVPLTW